MLQWIRCAHAWFGNLWTNELDCLQINYRCVHCRWCKTQIFVGVWPIYRPWMIHAQKNLVEELMMLTQVTNSCGPWMIETALLLKWYLPFCKTSELSRTLNSRMVSRIFVRLRTSFSKTVTLHAVAIASVFLGHPLLFALQPLRTTLREHPWKHKHSGGL